MGDYIQTVSEDGGQWCPNCDTAWRILKPEVEGGAPKIVEACYGCDDEEFDVYAVADDGP